MSQLFLSVRDYCYIYRAPSGGKSFTPLWLCKQTNRQHSYTFLLKITLFLAENLNTAKAVSYSIHIVSDARKRCFNNTLGNTGSSNLFQHLKTGWFMCQEMKNLFISSQTSFGFWVSAKSNHNLFFKIDQKLTRCDIWCWGNTTENMNRFHLKPLKIFNTL